ncbi:MAG: protein-glutamate O-methyltransferase CheR [Rhodospirillaceae bacterium]|nr:protein-glutamate O-methyltransferase CheR [Rhodospirillales bacterium]
MMQGDVSTVGLSGRDFKRLAEFVQGYAGIKMPATKKSMLEGRLRKRVRALGLGSFDQYCRHLFDEGGWDTEVTHLIDAVTTNKTDFFREPEHFRFLADIALPEMAALGIGMQKPLMAWSAAASIGAEAYSIAMLLADFAAAQRGFRFSVLATDICTEVLETAHRAIYSEEMIAPVPMDMRKRYLRRAKDSASHTVRIAPDLRSRVTFARLNLIEGPYELDLAAHLLFCRNILIYFDKPTQEAVVGNLCWHLLPGGYLFIGHSESIAGFDLPLRQVATAVFQRV